MGLLTPESFPATKKRRVLEIPVDPDFLAAFVTAFQAMARTPDSDTETVTITEIRLVGRNI